MKLEVLVSCMHQKDDALVARSNITGNVLVINQCDTEDYKEYPTKKGIAKIYSTCDRGLTKSRNMAIEKSDADICMLCDDDEVFCDDYAQKIICAYKNFPQADVIIFKMVNRPCSLGNTPKRIKFPKTMKVSSWQISFKRESLIKTGVRFDPLLGAGTGNGAEEELKFLLDCQKAGLNIFFVPQEIEGTMEVTLYNSSGSVMYHGVSESEAAVSTAGYLPGVYFYMASDAEGYRKTGKLLVK
jgi:glycosyltransferase involved in cell wall biosynthesis